MAYRTEQIIFEASFLSNASIFSVSLANYVVFIFFLLNTEPVIPIFSTILYIVIINNTVTVGEGSARWLCKELNKMEYPKKYLFVTFDYSSNQWHILLKKEHHLDMKNCRVKKKCKSPRLTPYMGQD
jgi:hypothetical protein